MSNQTSLVKSKKEKPPSCIFFSEKKVFMAWCENIWDQAIEKNLSFVRAVVYTNGVSITKKLPEAKQIKTTSYLTVDLFKLKEYIDDIEIGKNTFLFNLFALSNEILDLEYIEKLKQKEES